MGHVADGVGNGLFIIFTARATVKSRQYHGLDYHPSGRGEYGSPSDIRSNVTHPGDGGGRRLIRQRRGTRSDTSQVSVVAATTDRPEPGTHSTLGCIIVPNFGPVRGFSFALTRQLTR